MRHRQSVCVCVVCVCACILVCVWPAGEWDMGPPQAPPRAACPCHTGTHASLSGWATDVCKSVQVCTCVRACVGAHVGLY